MANEKLTQRTEYTGALDGEELQHVVKAGVSWKVKLSTIFTNLSTFLNLTDVKDTTYDGKWGYVPMAGNDNSLTPEPNALILTKLPTFQNLSKGNVLLAGGVNYISGLTYNLWATNYIINSQEYSVQLSANFTLSTADPTNSRIDVYYVGLNGAGVPTLGVLTGTPAASPIEPTLNLTTQVKITTQTILANQTSDPDAVFEMAFDENAGEPTEWDNLFLLPGGNLSYTTDPYSGTTSLLVPATTDNYVSWLKDAEYVFNSSEKLVFALKDMVDVLPGSKVQIKLINQTSGLYWILTLSSTNLTTYGYVFGASGWHVISIPLSAFSYNGYVETVDPDYDIIEVTFLGTSVGQLDWIHFQTGVSQPLPTIFVKEIIAGTNVTVDASDPQRPIVAATGGAGNVTKVGTPVNNQVGVWTGDGTLEGTSKFVYNDTTTTVNLDNASVNTNYSATGMEVISATNIHDYDIVGIDMNSISTTARHRIIISSSRITSTAGAYTEVTSSVYSMANNAGNKLSLTLPTITGDIAVVFPSKAGIIALNPVGYTVATLPAGVVNDRAYVTDATAPTYLGALTGGGAVICPVFHNGTIWVSS